MVPRNRRRAASVRSSSRETVRRFRLEILAWNRAGFGSRSVGRRTTISFPFPRVPIDPIRLPSNRASESTSSSTVSRPTYRSKSASSEFATEEVKRRDERFFGSCSSNIPSLFHRNAQEERSQEKLEALPSSFIERMRTIVSSRLARARWRGVVPSPSFSFGSAPASTRTRAAS